MSISIQMYLFEAALAERKMFMSDKQLYGLAHIKSCLLIFFSDLHDDGFVIKHDEDDGNPEAFCLSTDIYKLSTNVIPLVVYIASV